MTPVHEKHWKVDIVFMPQVHMWQYIRTMLGDVEFQFKVEQQVAKEVFPLRLISLNIKIPLSRCLDEYS